MRLIDGKHDRGDDREALGKELQAHGPRHPKGRSSPGQSDACCGTCTARQALLKEARGEMK